VLPEKGGGTFGKLPDIIIRPDDKMVNKINITVLKLESQWGRKNNLICILEYTCCILLFIFIIFTALGDTAGTVC
jgi:hypothetical protein